MSVESSSNTDICTASISGNRDAFAQIVRKYQNLVSAVTFGITGNLQQSEDLAQETFITAWQNFGELREPEKLPAWLCGIARNLSHKWIRKPENRRQPSCGIFVENIAAPEPENDAVREEKAELLWSTMRGVPERYREPLLMYYRQNQSVPEIAAALEISEDNARQRIARGRAFIKEEIERKVESALHSLKLSERFTIAVLAAIPVLATSSEVSAATTAAGSAGIAAKIGGGSSILAEIGAFLASLANALFFPLTVFFGIISGAWSGIRNSPTLRSRRFMLKATIFQAMMGIAIYTFICVSGGGFKLFISLDGGTPTDYFIIAFFISSIIFAGTYCSVSSYLINRKWRRIVEEDMTEPLKFEVLEQTGLSYRRLNFFLFQSILIPFIAIIPPIVLTLIMIECYGKRWTLYFYDADILFRGPVLVPLFGVTILVIAFYLASRKLVRNEQSMVRWPPKHARFLQLLTGEEKSKPGLAHRTNFFADVLLCSAGICGLQGCACINYFCDLGTHPIKWCHIAVFVISFALFLWFAIYYAGIPRRRYFGFVYSGLLLAALDTVFMLVIEPLLYDFFGRKIPFWQNDHFLLVCMLFWLTCFILVGVAGILAFRPTKTDTAK